jgi:hypothetical protein
VLALLVLGISNSRAEKSDVDQCRALFKKPGFDCVCVSGFMESHLGPTEREIILKHWAGSLDRDRLAPELLDQLEHRHGSRTITDALFRFNLIGVELFTACPSAQSDSDYGF